MTPPPFVRDLLAWRVTRKGRLPNCADGDSRTSVAIASRMLELLFVEHETTRTGQGEGTFLEQGVAAYLSDRFANDPAGRDWEVRQGGLITDFDQYSHLARLDELIDQDETGTLSVELGRDYQVRPDVTIGSATGHEDPTLHAAISCKFTIRSDRVQNVRHEGVILTRHRRGRQPHIVVVTAEPLPTRLAAIARGTGEIDAVYHVALETLKAATEAEGTTEQQVALEEIVGQHRLFDLTELPTTLLSQ